MFFLFQQLIKTHSLKNSPLDVTRHRNFRARHEVTSFMTSLQFLLFALRVTLNVLRFRNDQASLCYVYFVFIVVIKKITDSPK